MEDRGAASLVEWGQSRDLIDSDSGEGEGESQVKQEKELGLP